MKATIAVPWLFSVLMLSGCAIPIPHYSTRFQGVSGKVFDASTKRPIPGVHVSVNDNPNLSITTGADGAYSFAPQYNFHVLYVWFIMGDSLPRRVYWEPMLNFSRPNYKSLRFNAEYNIDDSQKYPRGLLRRRGNLVGTDVFLHKR